jgi:hypothetical protein
MVRPCSCPASHESGKGRQRQGAPLVNLNSRITVIGIDIGKNSFYVVGLEERGGMTQYLGWQAINNRWTVNRQVA